MIEIVLKSLLNTNPLSTSTPRQPLKPVNSKINRKFAMGLTSLATKVVAQAIDNFYSRDTTTQTNILNNLSQYCYDNDDNDDNNCYKL